MKHLQRGFIRVEDIPLQQFFVRQVIDRGQQMLRSHSSQLDMVCRDRGMLWRFSSCSCRYKGEPMTNFCAMRYAAASGVAKLPGMKFGSLDAFAMVVSVFSFSHFRQA